MSDRLQRSSWRRKAKEVTKTLPSQIQEMPPLSQEATPPPWTSSKHQWSVEPTIDGTSREVTLEQVVQKLDGYSADVTVYTDGSASSGTLNGGYAAVFTTGPASKPQVTESLRKRGRAITSSYDEEKAALLAALMKINTDNTCRGNLLICTDSQSLCKALESESQDTTLIRAYLDSSPCNISIQWIPGHFNVVGNEIADQEAKAGAGIRNSDPEYPSLSASLACIKRSIKDDPPSHHRVKRTYHAFSEKREKEQVHSKKDAVMLAQIRSGHSRLFKAYANLMDPTVDPTCPSCKEAAHTVEHWMDCQSTLAARYELFGTTEPRLELLSEEPSLSVALAKRTLLGAT